MCGLHENHFYPRPPRGGRLPCRTRSAMGPWSFLSTPSARRATSPPSHQSENPHISIHALREEGDIGGPFDSCTRRDFYPRPPRGGRQRAKFAHIANAIFLSTPSARRATKDCHETVCHPENFYPRPPRGGRPSMRKILPSSYRFLSTPSARRATLSSQSYRSATKFLSTPSARRATLS